MENTQKTPEQWFQMLREPYKSEAIANIDKEYTYYQETTKSLKDAIQFSFDWLDSRQRHTYWSKIYNSIRKGETTYLEPETLTPEPIELRQEEPTDWKLMYNELSAKFEELQAKYDQLEPKGEKVYFYFNEKELLWLACTNKEFAIEFSKNNHPIYEAVCIGKKKSVLVNE